MPTGHAWSYGRGAPLRAMLAAACCLTWAVVSPSTASAQGIQTTGGTTDVIYLAELDATGTPTYYVPQNDLQDVSWSYPDTVCPPHPAGPPYSLGSYMMQRQYYQSTFDTIQGGPNNQVTLAFFAHFTDKPFTPQPPGDTLIGVAEWRIHVDCLGNNDQEVVRFVNVIRRIPVGGGSQPGPGPGPSEPQPPEPGPPSSPCPAGAHAHARTAFAPIALPAQCTRPPKPDPCISPNRLFGGKTPEERALLRQLALAFNENAWDGQQLAEQVDLFGRLMDTVLGPELADAGEPAEPVIEGIKEAFETEATLVERQYKLETERKVATMDLDGAHLRQSTAKKEIARLGREIGRLERVPKKTRSNRKALAEARRELGNWTDALKQANQDVKKAADAVRGVRRAADVLERELAGVRRGLGDRLRRLARMLPNTPLGEAFGRILGVFNAAQDGAAIWMAANAAVAGVLNGLAKPPRGCNESWTKLLPKRAGVSSALAPRASAGSAAFSPLAAATPRPVLPGPFVTRRQAATLASVTGVLIDQLATAQALQREMSRAAGSSPKGARRLSVKLGRLLRQSPARYRSLASTFAFEPLPATGEVLADTGRGLARLRARLKRIGAPRSLVSQVSAPLDTTAPGEAVDPFAVLRDSALDDLGRAAADALSP